MADLYNIDISDAAGLPRYKEDRSRGFNGATDPVAGKIELGPKAFESPAILATTVGREAVHARQVAEQGIYQLPEREPLNPSSRSAEAECE